MVLGADVTIDTDGSGDNRSSRGAYVLAEAEGGARRATILVDEAYHEYVDDPSVKTSIPLAIARRNCTTASSCGASGPGR